MREPLQQRGIPGGIGGDGDEARVERAGIGQPRAGSGTSRPGGTSDGMDDRPVRTFGGEDDRPITSLSKGLRR
jgi:hypothetical protein